MINNFYNPVHYFSDEITTESKRESLQLRKIRAIIFNRREGMSLIYYRNGSMLYVDNAVGLKVMAFLKIFKQRKPS